MYIINDITFDHVEQLIQYGEKAVRLNPKANEVLLFMVQIPNQTISREEILNSVWSRNYVSDHSLTQAISDLRKALGELGKEPEKLIITRPKVGYILKANISVVDEEKSNTSRNAKVNTVTARLFFTMVILFVSIIFAIWWFIKVPAIQTIANPYSITFITFKSDPKYQHLAFGLSDLINYRINQQGKYRSSLLYEKSVYSANSIVVMSGNIKEYNNAPILEFFIYDNVLNKKLFEKKYLLNDKVIVNIPKKILSDIEVAIEAPFDHTIIDKLERQYPQDAKNFNLVFQAHYASNIITVNSLFSAIKLYSIVLNNEPDLEIAAAERLISAKILNSIKPDLISKDDFNSMYYSLLAINDELHPPIYYEALATFIFSRDNIDEVKLLLTKAVDIRESWLSNIITGKIAEVENKNYVARNAYRRAYSMKPDESTIEVINKLFFVTKLEGIAFH